MADVGSNGYVPPRTAYEAVLAELRRRILEGDLKPGEHIRQEATANELGVSRVPVREALKTLNGEGQVVYQPNHGYIVRPLALSDLEEIYVMRDLLEDYLLAESVRRIDGRAFETLADYMRAMENVGSDDIAELVRLNREFHFALYDASGLPRFIQMVRVLADACEPYRAQYYHDQAALARVHREHRELFEAVLNRDAQRAVEVMREHRAGTLETLRSSLA